MRLLTLMVLAIAVLAAAPARQTLTETITDSECAVAGHSQMQMGPTDAECTNACIGVHGASYVLSDGKNVYGLSDQKTPEKFAGEKVRVIGTLDANAKMINVDSIAAAK